MTNLLANAVAYSTGEDRIAVAARARSGFAEIAVTDSGIGIPRQDRQRVFERFYRVDQSRASSTGGTGLGLAIVKHVASNHGGSVTVWSEEGLGSTFTLRIPLAAGTARRESPADAELRKGTYMTRVLVVEDEESFSDALSYMLRREGFEAVVAGTGPDALAEFDRGGADIVLLDLMLPGLPGTEVCRALRSRSNVPIIMLTAKDGEIDKVVGLELGADDYVTKPYSARELVARIRAVLRRRGDAADGAAPSRRARGRAGPDGRRAARRRRRRRAGRPAAQGVRPARVPAAQRRPGAHPRAADRPGLGRGLRRRHQDPRRPRQAAARQDRARPGEPEVPADRARPGLQARGREALPGPPELRGVGRPGSFLSSSIFCEASALVRSSGTSSSVPPGEGLQVALLRAGGRLVAGHPVGRVLLRGSGLRPAVRSCVRS